MRIGFFLPQLGPAAAASSITRVAKRAEELRYDSLWVTDRLLYPLNPQTSYYGGPLPEPYKTVLDPVGTLTFVAGQTSRVALGTSVLDMPFYNPVLLARQLTTLDVVSGGRLRVGLGLGWSKDEYDAAGAEAKVRGRRADEFLKVLTAIWTSDPAEFQGEFFHLPKSIIRPKPIQKPHPPVYLAAYSPGAMKRTATMSDGWMPVGSPIDRLSPTLDHLRGMAKEAGRDPAALQLIARYNLSVTFQAIGEGRHPFAGTLEQIEGDMAAVKAVGPDELILDPTFSPGVQSEADFVRIMEELRKMV